MRESGYLTVDRDRVFWSASGDGPAVLLIHGGSIDSRMWDGQVAFLEKDYRVIRYDLRGLGESSRPNEHYRMSDDALAVLDHLGVTSAAVVGFSIGTFLALDLAVRAPERVAALAVSAVLPWNQGVAAEFAAARADLGAKLAPRTEAQRRGDLAASVAIDLDVWAAAHHGEARAALTEMCMRAPYFHEYRESDDEYHGKWPDLEDADLAAFTSPSLVIVGDRDTEIVRLASPRLAGILPGAELRVVPGADHFVSLGRPAEFNEALAALLTRRRAEGLW